MGLWRPWLSVWDVARLFASAGKRPLRRQRSMGERCGYVRPHTMSAEPLGSLLVIATLLGLVCSCSKDSPTDQERHTMAVCSTPNEAFISLTAAMIEGRLLRVDLITSRRARDSLESGLGSSMPPGSKLNGLRDKRSDKATDRAEFYSGIGKSWARERVEWGIPQDDSAKALVGGQLKQQTLVFVRTSVGWVLDEWAPGQ